MALINIEYGSLASSEIMNKNFLYLDDKIAESYDSIQTSISSILSNIATINSRLNEVAENMQDSIEASSTTIEDYKTKTKLLIEKSSMVPDWTNCYAISINSGAKYEVKSNGYILLLPTTSTTGNLTVNQKSVVFKTKTNNYDNSGQLVAIPVCCGDIVSSTATFDKVYFVPTKDVSVENF